MDSLVFILYKDWNIKLDIEPSLITFEFNLFSELIIGCFVAIALLLVNMLFSVTKILLSNPFIYPNCVVLSIFKSDMSLLFKSKFPLISLILFLIIVISFLLVRTFPDRSKILLLICNILFVWVDILFELPEISLLILFIVVW